MESFNEDEIFLVAVDHVVLVALQTIGSVAMGALAYAVSNMQVVA